MSLSVIPEVKFRPESFGGLAFNPSRALVVELNQTGYEILEKIADKGEVSEEEILASFSDIKGRLVLDFIENLRRSSILENGNGSGSRPLPHKLFTKEVIAEKETKKLTKYLSAPVFVWWDITKACNLKCKQCYSSAGRASPNELTTAEVFSIIEQLSGNGLFYIYFLGGEPLMRKDFFEILEKCRECSIVTMLSTNGWFVDKEVVEKLADAGIQIARVSIDGGTEEIHDTIRGVPGSFKRALKAVSLLKEGGVPNVGVSPTLLPDNYSQVDKIIELAIEYGADEVQVVQLCSTGRGEEIRALTLEEFKKARGLVQEAIVRYSDSHITATEGILRKQCERCVSERTAMPSFIGCAGGRSCMAINEEGLVFPCILYRKQAGNLREENLTDIWHHSPLFLSMREIKEDCLECAYSDVCARECPLAENTMTDEERKKFSDMIGEVSINKEGCDKFVSGNLCFIRF